MKKIFQFILAAGCAIVMAGCSEKDAGSNAQDNTAPITETSLKKAKEIALSKAGLSEKDGQWEKTKRDTEDGRAVYELEFISGDMEYEFEIDAENGNVIEYQKESVYD